MGCLPTQCTIGGSCVDDGTVNPAQTCEHCVVASSATAWSPRSNTVSCDDGDLCNGADVCDGAGACDHQATCGPGVTVTGLQIDVDAIKTVVGVPLDLVVYATRSDGSRLDVTAMASWSSSSPAVGVTGGFIDATQAGNATITASAGGFMDTASVGVVAAQGTAVAQPPLLSSLPRAQEAVVHEPVFCAFPRAQEAVDRTPVSLIILQ